MNKDLNPSEGLIFILVGLAVNDVVVGCMFIGRISVQLSLLAEYNLKNWLSSVCKSPKGRRSHGGRTLPLMCNVFVHIALCN